MLAPFVDNNDPFSRCSGNETKILCRYLKILVTSTSYYVVVRLVVSENKCYVVELVLFIFLS